MFSRSWMVWLKPPHLLPDKVPRGEVGFKDREKLSGVRTRAPLLPLLSPNLPIIPQRAPGRAWS